MISKYRTKLCVVFDLDDTLFREIDYFWSGHREIASFIKTKFGKDPTSLFTKAFEGGDWKLIDRVCSEYNISPDDKEEMIAIYRDHLPQIQLSNETDQLIKKLQSEKIPLGIITDGRSKTQRQKIRALGLDSITDILISEETGFSKPHAYSFEFFEKKYPGFKFIYVADNPKKDFVAPNKLGWVTIGLKDSGHNIHPQILELPAEHQPSVWISSINELEKFLI